jgi:GNAT superfamily N-acetyltransferase
MAKIKVRRINREELPGVVILRDAVAADLTAFPGSSGVLDLDMDIDPDLNHLLTHDPDGFFTAYDGQETLGFGSAVVRSRQWILSELWVLPQHQGRGAGDALLTRTLAYGERSGARQYLALVPTEASVQALLLKHGFTALAPVYLLSLSIDQAIGLAEPLQRLLPGVEVTSDLFNRRGQADVDRLDRLTRGIVRDADHEFWLKRLRRRAAFVRQGDRIAAYAYGSAGQLGPVAGSTQDAALAALGWALHLAVEAGASDRIDLLLPAPFTPAVETVLEGGGRLLATLAIYGRGITLAFDRLVFGQISLP